METKQLKLSEVCTNNYIFRQDGVLMRTSIENLLNQNIKVEINLENKEIKSSRFLEEAFVKLYTQYNPQFLANHLEFKQILTSTRQQLNKLLHKKFKELHPSTTLF